MDGPSARSCCATYELPVRPELGKLLQPTDCSPSGESMPRTSTVLRSFQWSSTLNLPKSAFPPRALEAARSNYLKRCTDDLYAWQAAARRADKPFVLHDGPPYANGSLHIGHALNKILKDVIVRFQLSQGRSVHYRPGWDCHGLPIEIKALQEFSSQKNIDPVRIRNAASKLALRTIEEQKDGFRRWGVIGDWETPYKTMDKTFELKQLEIFRVMVDKGLIYRQFKPVHWSPSSGTALAEAELEYNDEHVSQSAYVKYKLRDIPQTSAYLDCQSIYAIIWTTTPWTLPANRAIAFHNDIHYCAFKVTGASELLLVAQARLEETLHRAGLTIEDVEVVKGALLGSDLFGNAGVTYVNTFRVGMGEEAQPFLHAPFVSEESGTGLVHMAPGHGMDDYEVCRRYGIEPFAPLDDAANFTEDALPNNPQLLAGKHIVPEGVKIVLEHLKGSASPGENLVWAEQTLTHKSPIDWRTKKPTIVRATAQWFAEVDSIKQQALAALKVVDFRPQSGRSRLEGFVKGRSQWCISRQRAWGVPIPALYGNNGEAVMTPESVDHIIGVISERGIDSWWTDPQDEKAWIAPGLPADNYARGRDTMDVWFDSGTTWTQIPHREGEAPADVYLEGTDQHRGWFQSSLLTHVAQQFDSSTSEPTARNFEKARLIAPYKTVITHGFILDGAGRKMSKSIGNVMSPDQIMDGSLLPPVKRRKGQKGAASQHDAMGPDALRLWVAMSDYTKDVSISETILKSVNGALHKYRVTFKWLLGALADFSATEIRQTAPEHLADIVARAHLARTTARVHKAFSNYDFVKATTTINNYINIDLSAFYLETVKDPLYAGSKADKLRVQQTCFAIFEALLHMLKPVLPLLVTEVIDHASEPLRGLLEEGDVPFLAQTWGPENSLRDHGATATTTRLPPEKILATAEPLFTLHSAIKALQETARADKKIGSGLESRVVLYNAREAVQSALASLTQSSTGEAKLEDMLAEMFVVSQVTFSGDQASVHEQTGWKYSKSVQLGSNGASEKRDVLVEITSPGADKCPRCWRWVLEQERKQKDAEAICERCEQVMEEKGIDWKA